MSMPALAAMGSATGFPGTALPVGERQETWLGRSHLARDSERLTARPKI